MTNPSSRSAVIPAIRYRDAPAAIEFLCRVIGFEKHLVAPGPDNTVSHAQLALGGGMLMLGSADNGSDYGAREAGWTIVIPIEDEDYGGRGFSCLDPEGRLWNVGTYDRWA